MNMIGPTNAESLPALIDRAASALMEARTHGEVLEARDLATVAYDAAKSAGRMARAKEAHDTVLAKVYRAQADALLIESRAKMRLADEYDAAQERGEVASGNRTKDFGVADDNAKPATAADLGLRRDEIHEARRIRDAEAADPGATARALDEIIDRGDEPTKAALRRSVLAAVDDARAKPDRRNRDRVDNPDRDAVLRFIGLCEQIAATDIAAVASYADPQFPTTSTRLDEQSANALRALTQFKDARVA